MIEYETRILSYLVGAKGKAIFDDETIIIKLVDEAAGEFI